jgi:hypothetical protein
LVCVSLYHYIHIPPLLITSLFFVFFDSRSFFSLPYVFFYLFPFYEK